MIVDVLMFLLVIVIAPATNWMPSGCAEVTAQPMPTAMAFATMSILASATTTLAVCATDPVPYTIVDAQTILQEIVTATATKTTRLVNAEVLVRQTQTTMASATM